MIRQTSNTPLDLLFETKRSPIERPGVEIDSETDADNQEDEDWYVCRNCRHKLTRPSYRITIQGGHTHTFANPSGLVFEIACFNSAQGYSFIGSASTEFAWFSGFSWRIMICSSCLTHLGWYFSSPSGSSFFAFILDKIRFQSSAKD
jgi:hypothetical protein